MTTEIQQTMTEPMANQHHHHLLCWKSIVAGVFISILGYLILAALGAGVAGLSAESAISREAGGAAVATGAGLWLGLSAVIALFCGSYFTLRVSRFMTNKVGAAHGMVIASIFFLLMVIVAGGAVTNIAKGLGSLAGSAGAGFSQIASNPMVQDSINSALGSQPLKSPPQEVAQGLAVRLLQGDTASAKAYYAYQSGLTPTEVDAKITQISNDLNAAAKVAGEKAARAVADAGWSLFVTFAVGLVAAVMGGRTGAQANISRPFARKEESSSRIRAGGLASQNGSAMPYILGWLLGVPGSILLMIFLLRAVF